MSDTKETKQKPTLEQIEKELKGMFAAIGVLLNECFYQESGSKLIGAPIIYGGEDVLAMIDLNKTSIGRYLPIYYSYAYEGKLTPGYEREIYGWGDNIERLADFAWIFKSDSSYFDLCLDVAGIEVSADVGHLQGMIDRLRARHNLDNGHEMTIDEIALLADMSERSVKNAVSAEGTNRLNVNQNGNIANSEARRWLESRRGFIKTTTRTFPDSLDECPDQLDAIEIPAFVRDRISKRFCKNALDEIALSMIAEPSYDVKYEEYPECIVNAANTCKVSEEIIRSSLQQPLRISPQDCVDIARVIAVDQVWFTMQVMRALFPTPMDMLLNPSNYSTEIANAQIVGNSVDIILTEAMIKHGYLDLPMYAKSLFPDDCFGTRAKGDTGKQIELHYGGKEEETDIRIKSEQTISPRKRFSAWLQNDLLAKPGDRIRISRSAERVYELTHLQK